MVRKGGTVLKTGVLVIEPEDGTVAQAVLQATRLRILTYLASEETERRRGLSLQELGELLGCSPQNAHHHLRILAEEGLAHVVREERTQRIPRQFWSTALREVRFTDGFTKKAGRLRVALRTENGKTD